MQRATTTKFYSKRAKRNRSGSKKTTGHASSIARRGAILVAIIIAFSVGALLMLAKVERIEVSASNKYSSKIRKATDEFLDNSTRRIALIDTSELRKHIIASYPDIGAVSVDKSYLSSSIKVAAKERNYAFIWQSRGEQYLVDSSGFISRKPSKKEKKNLPVVIDTARIGVEAGQKVVGADFIAFLNEMTAILPEKGYKIKQIVIRSSTRSLEVALKNRSYKVLFNIKIPAKHQVDDLKLLLKKLKAQGTVPVEYIDLRIEGRAYWK